MAVSIVKGYRVYYINSSDSTCTPSALDSADDVYDSESESAVIAYVPTLDQYVDGGSCHALGQSVSRKYSITVSDPTAAPNNEGAGSGSSIQHVWQNRWSFSNRALGIMLATHGDDEGFVIPPRVAENRVILILSGSPHREQE